MRRADLEARDKKRVAREQVIVRRALANLEAGFQSIPALKQRRSLEEITAIAAEELTGEAAREGLSPPIGRP